MARDKQSPRSPKESDLLCNEDLDVGTHSQEERKYFSERDPNFHGVINPECMGIPSDLSQFEKRDRSEVSSNFRNDEGFEEFMRWGNKFGLDSKFNSPDKQGRNSQDNLSFTFTKNDDKSPHKEFSRTQTNDSKFDNLDVDECTPNELPSVNVPKRFTSSGAGELFEKHVLKRFDGVQNSKSSRNSSTCVPQSRPHKASIVMPKMPRKPQKKSPVSKHKPYASVHEFQCDHISNKRSRNSSKTGAYFTTGNKPNSTTKNKMNKLSRTNETRRSKGDNNFKEAQMFTFAKRTPIVKSKQKASPAPKTPVLKTPSAHKKSGKRGSKNRSTANQSSGLASTKTKVTYNTRNSDQKYSAITRQIASQASKRLSYNPPGQFMTRQR